MRKYIVVAKFSNKVIVLPVLTHEKTGLRYKKATINEYVSIRDWSKKSTAAAAENSHGLLWAKTYPEFEFEAPFHKMNDLCSVELTAPTTFKTELPSTIHGEMEQESLQRLLRLYEAAMKGEFS